MNPSHIQMTGMANLERGWGVIVRLSVAVAVSCLVLTSLAAADPAAAAIRKQTNISPQGLAAALQALAKDRELQVLYRTEVVGDRQTSGVIGVLTVDEALSKLLGGSGLTFQYLDDKTITILPVAESGKLRAGASVISGAPGLAGNRPDKAREAQKSASFWDRFRLAQADTATAGAATDTSEADKMTIEEIVVTAQKRLQRLQDVPISISVMEGEALDRSTEQGITDVLNRVPGVSALPTIQGGNTLLSVRGVTATGANFTGSSPVAYYLDYVPFAFVKSAFAPDVNAYDLERVEVLRGPQGTLYGASAQNGVMRVLTHPADLTGFGFKARASGSSTATGGNNSRIDSSINVPIVDGKLAARAVVGYQDLGGWIDRAGRKDANSGEVRNARVRFDARPTDALTLSLSTWSSRSDFDAASLSPNGETNPSLILDPIESDFDISGFKIGYEFAGVSVTSTTGYLDYFNRNFADFALLGLATTSLETVLQSRSFSQEVVLQSTGKGSWRWSLGGMYRDAKDRLYQNRRQYAQPTDSRDTSKSSAVFGELTRLFLDGRLELTGGLRYFEDKVSNDERSRGTTAVVLPSQLIRSEASFDKVSPRVVLTWHPTGQLTAYASYSEGFRSGFPQNGNVIASAPQFAPLKADNLKNYEVGTKTTFLQGAVSLEAAVFYVDWQDIQQTLTVNVGTPTSPVNVSALVNGQSASGAGAEFAIVAKPVDRLTLGLNFSWNDLNMDAPVLSGGVVLFREGDRLTISPEYVGGASAEYAFPVWGTKELRLWGSANYTSELESRAIIAGASRVVAGDPMLMGRAGVSLGDVDHWSASLFVDNVTNEDGAPIRQAAFLTPAFDTSVRPRTVGLQLEYRF
jgi:iron complex outermembrane receptor protein